MENDVEVVRNMKKGRHCSIGDYAYPCLFTDCPMLYACRRENYRQREQRKWTT